MRTRKAGKKLGMWVLGVFLIAAFSFAGCEQRAMGPAGGQADPAADPAVEQGTVPAPVSSGADLDACLQKVDEAMAEILKTDTGVVEELKKQLEMMKEQSGASPEALAEKEQEIERLKKKLESVMMAYERLKAKVEGSSGAAVDDKAKLEGLTGKLRDVEAKIEKAIGELEQLTKDQADGATIAAKEKEIARLREEAKALDRAIDELKAKMGAKPPAIPNDKALLEGCMERLRAADEALKKAPTDAALQGKVKVLKQECKALQEKVSQQGAPAETAESLKKQIQEVEAKLVQLDSDLAEMNKKLQTPNLADEEKKVIEERIQSLEASKAALENVKKDLNVKLERLAEANGGH